MDIFKLDKKDVKKLMNWRDNYKSQMRLNTNFAFLEGRILVLLSKKILNFKYHFIDFKILSDKEIKFSCGYIGDDSISVLSFNYKLVVGSMGSCSDVEFTPLMNIFDKNITVDDLILDVIALFFALNYYAIANRTIKEIKPLHERKDKNEGIKKIGKKSYATKEVSLENIIYINNNDNRINEKDRIIEYKKESWSVKGHLRHYKSGKSVFIKPSKRHRKITESIISPKEIIESEKIYTI